MDFITDCLSRNMSLRDIENKYRVTDVLAEYRKRKKLYTQEEIDKVMEVIYYGSPI